MNCWIDASRIRSGTRSPRISVSNREVPPKFLEDDSLAEIQMEHPRIVPLVLLQCSGQQVFNQYSLDILFGGRLQALSSKKIGHEVQLHNKLLLLLGTLYVESYAGLWYQWETRKGPSHFLLLLFGLGTPYSYTSTTLHDAAFNARARKVCVLFSYG